MADKDSSSKENPFSFKTFVKSKQETETTTSKIKKDKHKSKSSPASVRKRDSSTDEPPFPEVSRQVNEEGDDGNDQGVVNPFSFKNFLSDDLASRNKRVLQIVDDEVREVNTDQDNGKRNGTKSQELNRETAAQSDSGSETEDESELTSSLESPMSGSINYFVASLDSSETQEKIIEEMNQLKEENEKLRRELQESNQTVDKEKKRIISLQKKLAKIEKREADETAALENMVQMVEKNLELTTQRALRAEATVAKLMEEVNILKTESVPIATYNQLLDANHYTMTAVKDKSKAAADQMNIAAKNAEQAVRQLLTGVDTLKFISQQLESIDRITDVHVHSEKS